MSKRFTVGAIASIATIALSTVAVGPVGADPQNKNSFGPIAVDCGVNGSYDVVSHGNGRFSAAQVIGSNKVLVPLAFKNASATYTDPAGTTYPPEADPDTTKGSGKQAGVWCSYSFNINTGNGLENITGTGDVLAKVTAGQ